MYVRQNPPVDYDSVERTARLPAVNSWISDRRVYAADDAAGGGRLAVAYTYKVRTVYNRKVHNFLYLISELFGSVRKTCLCSIVKLVPPDVRF